MTSESFSSYAGAVLRATALFAAVPDGELAVVVGRLQTQHFPAGAPIIHEGGRGDVCYVLGSGEAAVVSRDLIGQEVTLATLGPGTVVGEVALLHDSPRTATVRAVSDVHVYSLTRADFLQLEATCPDFARHLRRHVDLLGIETFLRRASLFARLPRETVRALAEYLTPVRVPAGAPVVLEGDNGDSFYLIRSGQVAVEKGRRQVQTLESGDFFGEVALLTAGPRTATVRAITDTDLLALDKATFDAVVRDHEGVQAHLAETVRLRVGQRLGSALAAAVDPRATLAPLLASTRHGYWWKLLLAGLTVFAGASVLASRFESGPLAYAAVLSGAFVAPVTFVAYLWECNVLQQRPQTLLITFLLAAGIGLPIAVQIETAFAGAPGALSTAAVTALIEETVKLLGVAWLVRRPSARFAIDGVIYGAAAGMGFAAFETVLYGFSRIDILPRLLSTLWYRALLAPFGHGTWTAIACAAIWREKGAGSVRVTGRVLASFAVSLGLHAMWDWQWANGYLYLAWLLLLGVVGISVLRSDLEEASHEEAQAVLALNPELAEAAAASEGLARTTCRSCGQVALAGAHYCARCGLALTAPS